MDCSALEDLGKAWKRLTPLQPYFERMEVQPKFAAIVPQEEVVASTTFDVEINAPSGGVAKRPYIQGVAIADTNNVTRFEFTSEVRLKSGKSYTHDFTGYSRAVTAPYGTSSVNYNVYSGNQITSLALGGIWTSSGNDSTTVYGFFYDESANETYLLINDDDGDLQNGDWAPWARPPLPRQ